MNLYKHDKISATEPCQSLFIKIEATIYNLIYIILYITFCILHVSFGICNSSDVMHLLQLLELDFWLDLSYFMKGSTYHQLCLQSAPDVDSLWEDQSRFVLTCNCTDSYTVLCAQVLRTV